MDTQILIHNSFFENLMITRNFRSHDAGWLCVESLDRMDSLYRVVPLSLPRQHCIIHAFHHQRNMRTTSYSRPAKSEVADQAKTSYIVGSRPCSTTSAGNLLGLACLT